MTKDSEHWQTTITELMHILRDALIALVPTVERAKIAWRDEEAYDDWDDICESLYQNIVIRSLEFAEGFPEDLQVPRYGMVDDCYAGLSFFRIVCANLPSEKTGAFVAFGTDAHPFDLVNYVELTNDFKRVNDVKTISVQSVEFQFVVCQPNSERDAFTSICLDV